MGLSNPHMNEAKTPIGEDVWLKKQGLYGLRKPIGTVPTHVTLWHLTGLENLF